MCWDGRLILKGDRSLDLFFLTKLLMVWHKCPSKASLLRRIRVPEENTTCNLDIFAIQLASMGSRFYPKTISACRAGLRELEALGEVNLVAPNEIEK